MFVVIEFTNFKKEQEIIVHGYSQELLKAVEHAKYLCSHQKQNNTNEYIFKMEELDEHCEHDVYINLKNTPNSKVLHKFFMTQIERTTEIECITVCSAITNENPKLKKKEITLQHLLDYFDVPTRDKNAIKEDYSLNEQIGHEVDIQKYFIDLFKMKGYGIIKDILDYDIYYNSQVFGVVQVGSL
jgi:hypothetical protein